MSSIVDFDRVDPHKARDTMRIYCELYPFATPLLGGMVIDGLRYTNVFTGQFKDEGLSHWRNQYEWLVSMYPRNREKLFAQTVHMLMASSSVYFDRNLSVNIWYNFMEKYPDSSNKAMASNQIKAIREGQVYLKEDTTAS